MRIEPSNDGGSFNSTPGRRQDLSQTIADAVRWEILSLKRAPGSHIDEQQLCADYRVSRTPVREALKRLAVEEIVVLHKGRGATVAPIPLNEVGEFFDALGLIQRSVFMLAAQSPDDALLDTARAIQKETERHVVAGSVDDIPGLNMRLHLTIAEMAGNSYLTRIYRQLLQDGMRLAWLPLVKGQGRWESGEFERDHHDIIAAIAAQDVDKAAELADRHTELFRRDVIEALLSRGKGRAADILRKASEGLLSGKDKE